MTTQLKRATDTFIEIVLIYVVLLLSAGVAFSYLEAKPLLDSIWWACATATTVGYGDISPVTITGRIVAVLLMHLVPFVVAPILIVRLTAKLIDDSNQFSHEEQEEIKAMLREVNEKLDRL
jgi:voltage-gated potassium channel